jgi:hypothetical protein
MEERYNLVQTIMKPRGMKFDDIIQNKTTKLNKFDKLKNINIEAYHLIRSYLYFWTEIEDEEK